MDKTYAQVVSKTKDESPKQMQVTPKQTQVAPKQTQVAQKQTQVAPKQTQVAPKQTQVAPKQKNITIRCEYGEICYKGKLCADCIAYDDKKDMYNISCDNMRMDHRMTLRGNRDE